eukprot:1307989-Pleurochrysis_carterae.AAC.1
MSVASWHPLTRYSTSAPTPNVNQSVRCTAITPVSSYPLNSPNSSRHPAFAIPLVLLTSTS